MMQEAPNHYQRPPSSYVPNQQTQTYGGFQSHQGINTNPNSTPIGNNRRSPAAGLGIPNSNRIFKFVTEFQCQDGLHASEIKKVQWQKGVHEECVQMEIRKLATANLDSVSVQSAACMNIYDQNDNPVLLHEDMNFDCIYKVSLSFCVISFFLLGDVFEQRCEIRREQRADILIRANE